MQQIIKIKCQKNNQQPIEIKEITADVIKGLAIHATDENEECYTITHALSGKAVKQNITKIKTAQRIRNELLMIYNWEQEFDTTNDDLIKKVIKFLG